MSKVKVTGYIKNKEGIQEYQTKGIYQSDEKILKFQDNNQENTMILIHFMKQEIVRENKELKILLTFDKKKDTILNCKLKDFKKEMSFHVEITTCEVTENSLYLVYKTNIENTTDDLVELQITFTNIQYEKQRKTDTIQQRKAYNVLAKKE